MIILFVLTMILIMKTTGTETTKNPIKDENMSLKVDSKDSVTTVTWDGNPQANYLWLPASREQSTAVAVDNNTSRGRFTFWPAKSVTRLAKTVTLGLHPFFNKEYFQPFERRQKPVTVIGIRKNGLFSRTSVNDNMLGKSSEVVAELQSPYNEISSFWVDDKH